MVSTKSNITFYMGHVKFEMFHMKFVIYFVFVGVFTKNDILDFF